MMMIINMIINMIDDMHTWVHADDGQASAPHTKCAVSSVRCKQRYITCAFCGATPIMEATTAMVFLRTLRSFDSERALCTMRFKLEAMACSARCKFS